MELDVSFILTNAKFNYLSEDAWRTGVEDAQKRLSQYMQSFASHFNGKVPDERGLTDQFLHNIASKYINGTIDFQTISQQQEAKMGFDYAWSWESKDPQSTPTIQSFRSIALLQVKSYKEGGIVNFSYQSGKDKAKWQMEILDDYRKDLVEQVEEATKGKKYYGARVFAGYILYGGPNIQFVPLEYLLLCRKNGERAGLRPGVDMDRFISEGLFEDKTFDIQLLLHHKPN